LLAADGPKQVRKEDLVTFMQKHCPGEVQNVDQWMSDNTGDQLVEDALTLFGEAPKHVLLGSMEMRIPNLTELNISENWLGQAGTLKVAQSLAFSVSVCIIPDIHCQTDIHMVCFYCHKLFLKTGLSKLTFGDKLAVSMSTDMKEADFRGKLKPYEGLLVAAFLPKCRCIG
jgi:hypothetical protein